MKLPALRRRLRGWKNWPNATLLLMLTLVHQPLLADVINVAVAANFTDAARDLASAFQTETGHKAKISFGSTGKLYAQIEHGAPYHVFLAADVQRPRKAEQEGLAVPGSFFVYANGRLVLWSAADQLFADGDGPDFLTSGAFKRLAIANPKTAPYGLAAKQVLLKLGLWDALQPKLVRGDSIAQAFQFVATGNAQLGFVAASQAHAWKHVNASLWQVPEDDYEPIAQGAVLLNKGQDNPAAREFLEFLKSPKAVRIITGYGYAVDE